jgi:hypothetical protein
VAHRRWRLLRRYLGVSDLRGVVVTTPDSGDGMKRCCETATVLTGSKPDSDEREVRFCETCGAAYQIYPGPVHRFVILVPPLAQRILAALEDEMASQTTMGFDVRNLRALADELRERLPK